ncbi:MAG: DUF488 domain-containing protein [Methylocystis sp.]
MNIRHGREPTPCSGLSTTTAVGAGSRPSASRAAITNARVAADHVKLKRAYEHPSAEDGERVLVERLWPRGLKKADAAIDKWAKEISPTGDLRKWFGHDPARWTEFRRRYVEELHQHPDALAELRDMARHGPVTLVFSAHDPVHNNAVVLREILLGRSAKA